MLNVILYALAGLLVLVVSIYLIIEFAVKKWKCTEGQCEKVLGGTYSSRSKCQTSCKKPKQDEKPSKQVRFKEMVDVIKPTYDCVDGYCKEVHGEGGTCTNLNNCQANCQKPVEVQTVYQPVLYPTRGWRRPRRWSPPRIHRRRRHRRPRPGS